MGWLALWSVLSIISLGGVVASANSLRFERKIAAEGRALLDASNARGALEPMLDRPLLPPPVARYLSLAVPPGRPALRNALLRHGGELRTAPDARWMPVRGVELLATAPPGFVWWGRMRVAPGFWVDAHDRLVDGVASMTITAESSLTLSDVHGPQLDDSAMLRLLGELVWLPTALLDERHVRWTAVDERSARATLRLASREVAALFHFGDDGMPERVTANRYRDVNGHAVLTPWTGRLRDYRDIGGLRVPFEVESIWELDIGPFSTLRFLVESIAYDAPSSIAI